MKRVKPGIPIVVKNRRMQNKKLSAGFPQKNKVCLFKKESRNLCYIDYPNPPSNFLFSMWAMGYTLPGRHTVPDARRQGVTSEVYHSYAAGRNDRRQRSRWCRMVDQGLGFLWRGRPFLFFFNGQDVLPQTFIIP